MDNKKRSLKHYLILFIGIYILFCIFTQSFLWLPNSFFYLFNKDKEILAIDDSHITVQYNNSTVSDIIACENKCILNYDINYLSIGGKLYNSYSNITAILNDEFPLEVDKDNKENNFIWNDIYKTDTFVARLKMDNIPLKQGENKITVSSNNKVDSLLFYYNK